MYITFDSAIQILEICPKIHFIILLCAKINTFYYVQSDIYNRYYGLNCVPLKIHILKS